MKYLTAMALACSLNRIQFLLSMSLLGCTVLVQPSFAQDATDQGGQAARPPGGQIFHKWCSDCHSSADGPGSVALERKYQGQVPAILERRTDLNPDYVKQVVREGISFMPNFRKTEISDAELALLAAYLAPSQDGTSGGQAAPHKAGGSKHQ